MAEEEKKETFVDVVIEPFQETNWIRYYEETYTVRVGDHSILTNYCDGERGLANWIRDIQRIYRKHRSRLIVGLRLDRRLRSNCSSFDPNQFLVLTLCIGSNCIIIPDLSALPKPFRDFLQNPKVSFVGVGIDFDAQLLAADEGIRLGRAVDLRPMVEKKLRSTFKNDKIDRLATALLGEGFSVKRPENKTIRDSTGWHISREQLKNACVDAYLASEIGKKLLL